MARIQLTRAQEDWLWDNSDEKTQKQMADHIGVCEDTLKRILVRLGIREFSGAKFCPPVAAVQQMWNRACMQCGCTKPRPRNIYQCTPCKEHNERHGFLWTL